MPPTELSVTRITAFSDLMCLSAEANNRRGGQTCCAGFENLQAQICSREEFLMRCNASGCECQVNASPLWEKLRSPWNYAFTRQLWRLVPYRTSSWPGNEFRQVLRAAF
jgi:hypothetical protein